MISPTPTDHGVGAPVDPLSDPLIGQMLEGKYLIRGLLGAGGMSVVYDGEHVTIGRRVAIKVLHRHCAMHRELLERFEREARAAARIAHPNIVDVLDFGRLVDGIPYIVMELLEGQGLFERLGSSGAMPMTRAIEIVVEVLGALDAAHRAGVFHRDVKPENVFLVKAPNGTEVVKVVDFGIAKFAELGPAGPRLTTEGLAMGTPAYMPPEQATGSADIDARSDLYSTGVLLYELLSHRLPHEGTLDATLTHLLTQEPNELQSVAPWVPGELAAVVHKAISRRREDRYQSAAEMIEALQDFTKLPQIEIGPIPLFRRNSEPAKTLPADIVTVTGFPEPLALPPGPTKSGRRTPVRWAIASVLALAVLAGVGLLATSSPDPDAAAHASSARRSRPAPRAVVKAPAPRHDVPVTVSTNVAGARVALDGRPLGEAPLDTTVPISTAAQLLRVEADGYEAAEFWVRTSRPVRMNVTLDRVAPVVASEPEEGTERRPRKAAAPRLPFVRAY